MGKMTKLNSRFASIEYPVSLNDLEIFIEDFPKTERKFYEYAIKALRKELKKDENIIYLTEASSVTKVGFLVTTDNQLILVLMKGGLLGGAEIEKMNYNNIKEVDFDIIHGPFGIDNMNPGIIYVYENKMFGKKKRTIRNVPEMDIDTMVKIIRSKLV